MNLEVLVIFARQVDSRCARDSAIFVLEVGIGRHKMCRRGLLLLSRMTAITQHAAVSLDSEASE